MYHYLESGLDNVWLINGYTLHETKYGSSMTIDNVKGLHAVIGQELLRKPSLLNEREIRFIRKELGFSQKLLADTMSIAEVTLRKWESSSAKISGPADRLLRLIFNNYLTPNSEAKDLITLLAKLDSAVEAHKKYSFGVSEDSHDWQRNMVEAALLTSSPNMPSHPPRP